MSEYEYDFLRESLTVVLNDELGFLMENADEGYPDNREFRKFLYREWQKHHDSQLLIDVGVRNIGRYLKDENERSRGSVVQ